MSSSPDQRLRGVLAPVLTPFDAGLKPDATRFVRLCQWLVAQDCGLAMFGTNSEGNSLAVSERIDLLEQAISAGVPAARMLPGTGSCSLVDAVRLTRAAVDRGCAGVLALPPFYYKSITDDGLFAFFSEVIERVGDPRLRVYLYHIPPVAQVGFSHALVERLLRRYPGVVAGMKDTGGDWAYTARTIELFGSEGFDVFAGTETILLDTLRRGGAGCISATANVNPKAIVALFSSWQDEDAPARQAALNAVRSKFAAYPLIPAMKSAIAMATNDPQWTRVRPPLEALDAGQQEALGQALREQSFAITDLD
ncbi:MULTISPECIES: dihydrodipicolinate synthase family protein [unclassified Variovorax]|jgi:4-hydroxy-tetrahydrodipicolinate synthase|uniref:dihydrodipicolinate synthase family protein n=1 Tax=unclassified Variovorax TaxID=663243 RepID=UPI000F7F2883|nr:MULTISPECIES: dihydrodipicolinate synthase family protein [unclassified Variovorax]RSZ33230.1 dihydrodipicolinate synthase family protein [Variovorax sp. 553]RSZ33602.1 dihydrodipicolinate synthase family protein [Variovorax sp. 679]